jgi:hypothetical protein
MLPPIGDSLSRASLIDFSYKRGVREGIAADYVDTKDSVSSQIATLRKKSTGKVRADLRSAVKIF